MNYVGFPMLGLEFNINPIAFQFFGTQIHWYGIMISIAFLIALFIILKLCKSQGIDEETVIDIILITAPIAVIGARLYYVVFNYSQYSSDLSEVFKIWHGGLAVYGAIIASIITIFIYSKVKHINIWPIADIGAIGFVIAQSIGRWGNFVNAEAYGVTTTLPWGMAIIENGIYKIVHPTFLYESLWNLFIFCILMFFYYKYKKMDGDVFFLYIALYGFGRFFIESLRSDSLYLGIFRVSQIVSAGFLLIAIIYFIKRLKYTNKQE